MGLSCIPKSDFEDCDRSARSQVKKGARSKNRTRGHQNEEKDEALLFAQAKDKKVQPRKESPCDLLQDISESESCVNLPEMTTPIKYICKRSDQIIAAKYFLIQEFRQTPSELRI